ncbi:MAG: right-handed parallel beta-helix repeat-containing protein [Bacteroides sp.]|jgi:hypothetical protein
MKKFLGLVVVLALIANMTIAKDWYVSVATGSNKNEGTQSAPLKDLQKAIDMASAGDKIYIAAGNYTGKLDVGYISVPKPVEMYGGYSTDFSSRDILKNRTTIYTEPKHNGTAGSKGLIHLEDKITPGKTVIDGFLFDRGGANNYKPVATSEVKGLLSGIMVPDQKQTEKPAIYGQTKGDMIIRNCVFNNMTNYALQFSIDNGASVKIENNVFTAVRYAAIQLTGRKNNVCAPVEICNNTILFVWTRTKAFEDMGYGIRAFSGTSLNIHDNVLGLTYNGAIDLGHSTGWRWGEKVSADRNAFFMNKAGDVNLPSGGGMFLQVNADDMEDIDQLSSASGNYELKDVQGLKRAIDAAYLDGFINATYSESVNHDPNSSVNQFRSAMGMNQVGTIQSKVTMFMNRYPIESSIKCFGAVKGVGAQLPR